MKTDIKRIAQFMWDNADAIAEFLTQSERYRSVSLQFNLFAPKEPSGLNIEFAIYDEDKTHLYLHNNNIVAEEFAKLREEMNRETGIIPPREPVEVREKLEIK